MAVEQVHNETWDIPTLTWGKMKQPILEAGSVSIPAQVTVAGTVTATGSTLSNIDVNTAKIELTVISGSVAGSGNNTVLTPTAGKKLRISYLSYNPALAVECAWRFGAAGPLFIRNNMPAGGIVAKDFGDMRYLEGEINESLILNLSSAVTTIWNCL